MNRSHSQEHLYSKVSHESLRFLKVAFVIKQFLIPEILLHYPESRHFLLLTLLLKVFLFYCTYFCSLSVLNYFIILSFHQMQWFPSYLGPVLNFLSFFFLFLFSPSSLRCIGDTRATYLKTLMWDFYMWAWESSSVSLFLFAVCIAECRRQGHIPLCFLALFKNYLKWKW